MPEATTTVNAETWNAADATVDFSATLPVIELYQNFKLTAEQVEREATHHEGRGAAVRVAQGLSVQADKLVMFGSDADLTAQARPPVSAAANRLLPAAANPKAVGADDVWGDVFLAAANDALASLRNAGHYGPFALITTPAVEARARSFISGSTVSAIERLSSDIGFVAGAAALASGDAAQPVLIVSTGANAMDLVVADEDFALSFVRIDEAGMHEFRIAHRLALRLKIKASDPAEAGERGLARFDIAP